MQRCVQGQQNDTIDMALGGGGGNGGRQIVFPAVCEVDAWGEVNRADSGL